MPALRLVETIDETYHPAKIGYLCSLPKDPFGWRGPGWAHEGNIARAASPHERTHA
jgi:hypothetical protein